MRKNKKVTKIGKDYENEEKEGKKENYLMEIERLKTHIRTLEDSIKGLESLLDNKNHNNYRRIVIAIEITCTFFCTVQYSLQYIL